MKTLWLYRWNGDIATRLVFDGVDVAAAELAAYRRYMGDVCGRLSPVVDVARGRIVSQCGDVMTFEVL